MKQCPVCHKKISRGIGMHLKYKHPGWMDTKPNAVVERDSFIERANELTNQARQETEFTVELYTTEIPALMSILDTGKLYKFKISKLSL